MPSSKKIDLNEALEDSPQIQLMVNSMEGAVGPLKDFISQLKETCQTLHLNQMKVAESVSAFASVLGSADDKLFDDKNPFVGGALRQLGKYVSELYSWQEMLCNQLEHAVVQQLDSFLSNDLTRLSSLKDVFHTSRAEHEQAIIKYNRVSKKKETERSRFDANSELFAHRRRFHQSSMQYYAELNNLQYRRKFSILDPMLAFIHSQLAYFKMGHEILTDEVGRFLTMLNVEIQKVRSEHDQYARQQKHTISELEHKSSQLCIPDLDPSDPFVEYQPPNLSLTSKSGYLLFKQQGTKWERIYFYTKGHLFFWHQPNKAAESLLDLTTNQVECSTADVDDRRYVLQITQQLQSTQSSRTFYFQAESAKSCDEWIATINNICSINKEQPKSSVSAIGNMIEFEGRERSDSDVVRMERERVRTFVQTQASSSKLATPPQQQPQPQPKKKRQSQTSQQPPDNPPPRPPPPQKRQRPPPPMFGNSAGSTELNPVQKLLERASENDDLDYGAGYLRSFQVRYLGSLEVDKNTGVSVVKETIRRIVAARALKNIMAVFYVNMVITHKGISLVNTKNDKVIDKFHMKDVSYCARHPENDKLFGIIARKSDKGVAKFVCFVFESEVSGKQVCQAVIEAIKTAVKIITEGESPSSPTSPTSPTSSLITGQFPPQRMPLEKPQLITQPPDHYSTTIDAEGRVRRMMPKSHSTGSFMGRQDSDMNMRLNEDELTGNDSAVVKEQLIDFISPAQSSMVDQDLFDLDATIETLDMPQISAVPANTPNSSLAGDLIMSPETEPIPDDNAYMQDDSFNPSLHAVTLTPPKNTSFNEVQFSKDLLAAIDPLVELQRATDVAAATTEDGNTKLQYDTGTTDELIN